MVDMAQADRDLRRKPTNPEQDNGVFERFRERVQALTNQDFLEITNPREEIFHE